MSEPAVLELDRVGFTGGGRRILDEVTLALRPGGRVAVTGPNGAGKSALAHVALGLLSASSGRVRLFGLQPTGVHDDGTRRVRGRIGAVLQGGSLLGALTSAENVRLALGASPPDAGRRSDARLERLFLAFGAETVVDRAVDDLSVGERRRVELVRAFAREPDLVVLDEPFEGADADAAKALEAAVLRMLRRRPAALLLLTRDAGLAQRLGARELRLERGTLQQPVGAEAAPVAAS